MRYTLNFETTDAEEVGIAHDLKVNALAYVPPLDSPEAWLLAKLRERVSEATGREEQALVQDVAEAIAADPALKEEIREKLPTKPTSGDVVIAAVSDGPKK